mmetsp:Transcript_18092/g.38669  ORF Transcript_18092/g.38669 Transcript_18092/m.38669 type:complete len:419 (-) Transcript_18092:186-1442(-)|eukprot:CAMPEP_0206474430 /NCGR_PEP_ID=MMETSP0324_2-20121206/33481_1 /ASSEMBLY_ACC=CAM_ASM_000836 /TAXON_ID=2866 /ORGANISM="Crypthecodinium cohnii, Strain Seligo" /LENGTH=418 /DNA_ID=CAMNT_0053949599 /DNA_START=787 /DNA_END=2043 /DNA_ORIENTATION=+
MRICFGSKNSWRPEKQEEAVFSPIPRSVGREVELAVEEEVQQGIQHSLFVTKTDLHWDDSQKDHDALVKSSYKALSSYVAIGARAMLPKSKLSTEGSISVSNNNNSNSNNNDNNNDGSGSGVAVGEEVGQLPKKVLTIGRQSTPPPPLMEDVNPDDLLTLPSPGTLVESSSRPDFFHRAATLESQSTFADCSDAVDPNEEEVEDIEHRAEEVYAAHGLDFAQIQGNAERFLHSLGMRPHEVGSRNYTKWRGRTLWNQCFYLSLSHAYLGPTAGVRRVRGLARRLRRAIEAVVLEQHPTWATGLEASAAGTGCAMVFADFLPLAMNTTRIPIDKNLLAQLVVCIIDSVYGHAEVYIGPAYDSLQDPALRSRNLILLWHKPAHYQCLVRDDEPGSKLDYNYEDLKALLVKHGVNFIETRE